MGKCNDTQTSYLHFRYTKDGSAGLYNSDVDDVYHSVYGARSEGWEKFILPLEFEKNYSKKKSIKVLDICYGIGYNTKALLKKIIHSDYKGQVEIDALEYDKNLVLLSPFVKDGYFNTYPMISFILISCLSGLFAQSKEELEMLLNDKRNLKFIEDFYRDFKGFYNHFMYSCDPREQKKAFVHNIYYHCISQRKKITLKHLKNDNIAIRPYFDDARKTIKSLNTTYDIVFLDAFTPAKLPTLWSYDFFKELRRLSNESTMIVTYSNSSAVRHAMSDAGFFVGKLFDRNNRHCGTIASTDKDLIKYPLDNYDIGLMNTNAGVYYRDENLDKNAEEILDEYNARKQISGLESSSQYIKRYKKLNGDIR